MSNSPEDFPLSTPDAGGNPQKVQPHLEDVPYAEMTLKEAIDAGLVQPVVDPNTLQQVQEKTYRSERPPAIEPAMDVQPASKNNKLRNGLIALGVSATGIAIAAGAWMGLSGEKDDTTPKSETTASAPVKSGEATPPADSKTTAPGEKQAKPVSEWKFYNADGTFKTAQQVKKEAAVSPEQNRTVREDLNAMFAHLEATVNYFPDRKTVLEALNISEDELSPDDFITVGQAHQDLVFDTLLRGNGELRKWFDVAGLNALSYRVSSILNEDKVEYHMSISQDIPGTQTITVTDNAALSGAQRDPAPDLGTYRFISHSADDLSVAIPPAEYDPDTYINTYTLDSNIQLIKKTK